MMRAITLNLNSALRSERVDDIASFVGADAGGSFGILPGRSRFMTVLDYGLARFRTAEGDWNYLACPGAVLYFSGDQLTVNTRRYIRDQDYARISGLLAGKLAEEENALKSVKDNLQTLENELLRRLRKLDR
jgi:F-type H+-transporting ATPase subunit epsilon